MFFFNFNFFLTVRPSVAEGLLQAPKSGHTSEFPVSISVLCSPCYEYLITFIHVHWGGGRGGNAVTKWSELKWKSLPAFTIDRGESQAMEKKKSIRVC